MILLFYNIIASHNSHILFGATLTWTLLEDLSDLREELFYYFSKMYMSLI